MSPEKAVVDQLIRDLRNRPLDFSCGEFALKDKKTNIEYWIKNGYSHAGIYRPYEMEFGFIQGYRFHKALKAWKAAKAIYDVQRAQINY